MKEHCFTSGCDESNKYILADLMIAPFDDRPAKDGMKEMPKLFSFFLHNAPNIESAHSKYISDKIHPSIFDRMLEKRDFKYKKFCSANAVIDDELSKGCLDGDAICLKCKRFVCKRKGVRKGSKAETELECFLRHIRNSIAHGRVYVCRINRKIHIIFEDINTSKKLSARIVCIKADLEHWKKVLSDKRYYS